MTDIVFFGTHSNAAPILEALATNQGFKILFVVTQPDKPAGRDASLKASPVKIVAQKYSLPIAQPLDLQNFIAPEADLYIVCAYGVIIPSRILNKPPHGCLNIHYSLLPKYRGPSPFQTALINGDNVTGVTIMLLDEKMDHGPILGQIKVPVAPDDTSSSLCDKLNTAAIPLLIGLIPKWIAKQIAPEPQKHALASYCRLLTRDDGRVNWQNTAHEIYNQFRGLTPWPGVWTTWDNQRLKLHAIQIANRPSNHPGEVQIVAERIYIGCADFAIEVFELQPEGKRIMNARDFLSGHNNFLHAKLS